jgi:hypothetical protein
MLHRYLYTYAHRYYVKKHPKKRIRGNKDTTSPDEDTNLRFPGADTHVFQGSIPHRFEVVFDLLNGNQC